MIDNFSYGSLSDKEIVERAQSYYRGTLASLTDYSRHCNRAPGLADISAALAGGETDD